MKKRNGFVSNSSSSSFVISKDLITARQRDLILNHGKFADGDDWNIEEDEFQIKGDTIIDNFDMEEYFEKIGINPNIAKWTS